MTRLPRCTGAAIAAVLAGAALPVSHAVALPPGFVDQFVATGLPLAVGVRFAPDGRGFVWEQSGRVWLLENGQLSAEPLIDIREEVGNWRELGLLGFAIDPDYYNNGRIYLAYTVDYHHLRYFGTPEYNPQANEYFHDTIGRITRYTCNAADGFRSVDPSSRFILVGETMSTGFPVTHESHTVGTLVFGEDGMLLAGSGDGSTYTHADGGGFRPGSSNTALIDGIIQPHEDVGAFRAQLLDSLSGRIIRIDPETGDGVPGNPYYDPANPRSARSRTWVLGLRNPFRFTLRPGTGQADPAVGDPGTLYIGDVGWYMHEELNVAPTGGLNFGWPLFEGLSEQPEYFALDTMNLTAPNPLAGQPGCPFPFFRFRDLLVQATLGVPRWRNPCSPTQNVPAGIPRWVHTRPVLEYGHTGIVSVPTFVGLDAAGVPIDDPASPVAGSQFTGRTVVGGAWYTEGHFPAEWRNVFYFADFVEGWIRAGVFDEEERLLEVRPFHEDAGRITSIAVNPADGGLYYITYDRFGIANLRRIVHADAFPPTAAMEVTPAYGPLPLTVSCSSAGSGAIDGSPVQYQWDFGDASPPSSEANPTHVYTGGVDITDLGTIVARVFELAPPFPYGAGAPDPEVIRDRDWPPLGGYAITRQYDTTHDAAQGLDDWIGYTFPEPMVIDRVTFQEGQHFPHGGWFDSLWVEYFDGSQWRPVSSLVSDPPYPGNNGINFETFVMSFQPVEARGVRIRGVPGGEHRFVSVAELRVRGMPAGQEDGPRRYDVRLTVTAGNGQSASAEASVSGNNSPPQVSILSPIDGAAFRVVAPTEVPLIAGVNDAEHGVEECECVWRVLAQQPGQTTVAAVVTGCDTSIQLQPPPGNAGCDGTEFRYEVRLTVSDPLGLSGSATASMYPNCCRPDWNNDQVVNMSDIAAFLESWVAAMNGGAPADFDGNGITGSPDIAAFLTAWLTAVNVGC